MNVNVDFILDKFQPQFKLILFNILPMNNFLGKSNCSLQKRILGKLF